MLFKDEFETDLFTVNHLVVKQKKCNIVRPHPGGYPHHFSLAN